MNQDVLNFLSGLSVIELCELIKELRCRWDLPDPNVDCKCIPVINNNN